MHLSLVVLFCVTLTGVSCSLVPRGDDCKESPWLCRVISELNRKIDEQNLEITQQNLEIFQMKDEYRQQIFELSQQKLEISQLKDENRQQNLKISLLVAVTHEQTRKIDQQYQELSRLNAKVDVKQNLNILQANLVDLKSSKHGDDGKTITTLAKSNVSTAHDHVKPRTDDGGPLEAVVNQMSQQITTMNADIQALKNSDHQQDVNIQDARTSTYVRWGSSHCPADAQLVYSGAVGGSHYTEAGGGVNYLCLTMSPVFGVHDPTNQYADLYGAEYETYDVSAHNMDAVCAVCRSSHATTIMIPGTNVCTAGWTKQYDGFLMAERQDWSNSEYVCVDSAMESRPGTNANLDGALFYFTQTKCGSLPCAPYQDNKLVTCVVCSM
jgi:hypothetical protein